MGNHGSSVIPEGRSAVDVSVRGVYEGMKGAALGLILVDAEDDGEGVDRSGRA